MPPLVVAQPGGVSQIGAGLGGNVSLPGPPTAGNLLVIGAWGRGDIVPAAMPVGFDMDASLDGVAGARPWLFLASRRVINGDPAAWLSPASPSRVLVILECVGIRRSDVVTSAGLAPGFAAVQQAVTAGTGLKMGIHANGTDIAGRECHVSGATVLIWESWAEAAGTGPYGVMCWADVNPLQATHLNTAFDNGGYIAGNYPPLAAARFSGSPGGEVW